jgi:hypothetical protein
MEIPDTVVEGHEGFTEGSEEYMVFQKVLIAEAGRVGLHPVRMYTQVKLGWLSRAFRGPTSWMGAAQLDLCGLSRCSRQLQSVSEVLL